MAAHELSVDDDADTDTVRNAHVSEAMRGGGPLAPCPHLGQRTCLGSVFDMDWESCPSRQGRGDLDVTPPQRGSVEDAAGVLVDYPRHNEPDALASRFNAVIID